MTTPSIEEARDVYRRLWSQYVFASDAERPIIERLMDEIQPLCMRSPNLLDDSHNADFRAFLATLPGYLEYWEGVAESIKIALRTLYGEDI